MRRRNFTLLEVLIATGILALLAGASFFYSSGTVSSWARITKERNRFHEILQLDRTVDGIFTHAIPFLWRDPEQVGNSEIPFLLAEPNRLRIATMHRLHSPEEGAIRFVELSLQDNALVLTWADRPFLEWEHLPPESIHSSILSKNIAALSFQYADWSSDVSLSWEERMFWQDIWETEDSGRRDIPLAILMYVEWEDGRSHSWLRRTTGNSYRERYGTWNPPTTNL